MAGAIAAALQFFVQLIEQRLQNFADRIEDVRECADEISKILDYEELTVVTEDRLTRPTGSDKKQNDPFMLVAFRQHERVKLLVPKAIEHGLLERLQIEKVNPKKGNEFKLTFNPVDFKPDETHTKHEASELTVRDSAMMFAVGSAFAFGLVALTVHLKNGGHTGWAILPGVFGGLFALMGIVGFATLIVAIRNDRK